MIDDDRGRVRPERAWADPEVGHDQPADGLRAQLVPDRLGPRVLAPSEDPNLRGDADPAKARASNAAAASPSASLWVRMRTGAARSNRATAVSNAARWSATHALEIMAPLSS
jgi:hypothetical protein